MREKIIQDRVPPVRRALAALAALAAAGAGLLLWAEGAQAQAGEPMLIQYAAGAYDFRDDDEEFEARIEWRSGYRMQFGLGSLMGAMTDASGDVFVYAGAFWPIPLGDRFEVIPSFAPGLYGRGSGKNLGHVIEFRSQIEIAYRYDTGARLGLAVSHISNAGLDERNPGANSLVFTISIPLTPPD